MKTQKNGSSKKSVAIRLDASAIRNLRSAEKAASECSGAFVTAIDTTPSRQR